MLTKLGLVRNIKGVKRTCRVQRRIGCRAGAAAVLGGTRAGCTALRRPTGGRSSVAPDTTVKVYRARERNIQAHVDRVMAVAVLPDGARFVSVSKDGTAKLWTLDGALERTFRVGGSSRVHCAAVLPDGVHFVVGLSYPFPGRRGPRVQLYHVNGTLVHNFTGHTDTVYAVAVTRNGQHIISGSVNSFVKVWSVATKNLVSSVKHTGRVQAVAAMPDGQRILSGKCNNTVRVAPQRWPPEHLLGAAPAPCCPAALPDNQHARSGSDDKTVKLFNVNDGAVVRTFKHHTGEVRCLALLPDGSAISGSDDKPPASTRSVPSRRELGCLLFAMEEAAQRVNEDPN